MVDCLIIVACVDVEQQHERTVLDSMYREGSAEEADSDGKELVEKDLEMPDYSPALHYATAQKLLCEFELDYCDSGHCSEQVA